MNRMKKRSLLVLLMFSIPFLSSCSSFVIDDVLVVQGIGLDYTKDGKIRGTALFPLFRESTTEEPSTISVTTDNTYNILQKINEKSALRMVEGQTRILLFGKAYAKHNIEEIIHSFSRSPSLGRRVHVAVVDGKAETMLQAVTKKDVKESLYITDLIEQNIHTENLPYTNLHVFFSNYYGKGRDVFLPYLGGEKNEIKLKGLAIFDKERLVTTLNMKETFLFKLIRSGSKNGLYHTFIKAEGKKGAVVLRNLYARQSMTYSKKNNSIKVDVHINGLLKEYPAWVNAKDRKQVHNIEDQIKNELTKNGNRIVQDMQKLQVDPIGFEDFARSKTRHFDWKEFHSNYPDMDIKVNIDVKLTQTGIGE
ncbi:Ger(x)C family spore germination protein [Priestia endophytica]|nr:Ger(x)C family spore germination protein [Priestia endophytica]RAS73957.1 hypothetical protein A4U60_22415 [Priestia endophytica]RAS81606.1 hypothetical protein A4R27_11205 [Priestia endophytica]